VVNDGLDELRFLRLQEHIAVGELRRCRRRLRYLRHLPLSLCGHERSKSRCSRGARDANSAQEFTASYLWTSIVIGHGYLPLSCNSAGHTPQWCPFDQIIERICIRQSVMMQVAAIKSTHPVDVRHRHYRLRHPGDRAIVHR